MCFVCLIRQMEAKKNFEPGISCSLRARGLGRSPVCDRHHAVSGAIGASAPVPAGGRCFRGVVLNHENDPRLGSGV